MSVIERMLGVPPAPPAVDRINHAITRRPRLPLIAMGIVVLGLVLIVALTISAGAHSGNFNDEGPAGTLSALTFRPWFRIALLAGVGILLSVSRHATGPPAVERSRVRNKRSSVHRGAM